MFLLSVLQIKAVVTDPHPNIDLYFNDSDMSFLKIILEVRSTLLLLPRVFNVDRMEGTER
jgi:hypothetical protein